MCAIKENTFESRPGIPSHLLTHKTFDAIYTDHPQAIKNCTTLTELCDFAPENRKWIFPTSKNRLADIVAPKEHTLTRKQHARLQYEYRIIKEMGFEPYFCLVYDLKEFARSRGIGMNVRGSAASSYILYLLGLSVVDPILYNLPFERFLNPQRTEPPDIDVDVEFNERDKLIREIISAFGSDHVAHISVINRFRRRSRFRNTARAYGISPQELKNIVHHTQESLVKQLYDVAKKIDQYPHYFSCHASGIVITPEPVCDFVPLYPSPAGQITHFDKDGIEMVGLVKIDILGVRGFPYLYVAKDTIDFNDKNVYHFISEAKTLGCFQIESPIVRQFLRKIKPQTLMDIANAIAIIRPGPAQGGMKERFLRRLKGDEKVTYPHPSLEKALTSTLGIPVYQEQILQIAHDFAHFSLSNGDMLRRAMTKERNTNRMEGLKNRFFTKATNLGYRKKEIQPVWKRIEAFSSFGFNMAHSITYATLAYLSAYQKHYNPRDFFCRVINNKGGYYTTYAYVNEARRWGITIKAPDVNTAQADFSIHNDALITGLDEVKDLSAESIQRILRFRPFKDATDFFCCTDLSIDEGTSLIRSGGLDGFGMTWPHLYFLLLNAKSTGRTAPCFSAKVPEFKDFSTQTRIHRQFQTINFLPEQHILEVFYPSRTVRIADLVPGTKSSIIGALIAQRTIYTAQKRVMSFLTLDDETGTLEVIIFPNKYRPHTVGAVMHVEGMFEDNSLIADSYTPLPI
jgi:DNA-directed DNA polymerase III PolC